ncbi:MAG: type II secretion system GspH family protein [Pirellulales bacterium]|nr:type II secretion system GspH family protein [Pirellulales bacterium]
MMHRRSTNVGRLKSAGFSLLELLAVVAILGALSAIAVVRFSSADATGKKNACYVNSRDVEAQVQLWYRNHLAWPATNLKDIGDDTAYFPKGLPRCPVDGSRYTIDATTHRVVGHTH